MKPIYYVLALVLVGIGVAAVWAAGMESTATAAMQGKPAATIVMTDDLKFKPGKVTVRVGDTVEWKNTSKVAHTVTDDPKLAKNKKSHQLPEGAMAFNSGNIAPGKSWTYTFTTAGTYKYFCVPHESNGMAGEVVVKAAKEKGGKQSK